MKFPSSFQSTGNLVQIHRNLTWWSVPWNLSKRCAILLGSWFISQPLQQKTKLLFSSCVLRKGLLIEHVLHFFRKILTQLFKCMTLIQVFLTKWMYGIGNIRYIHKASELARRVSLQGSAVPIRISSQSAGTGIDRRYFCGKPSHDKETLLA